jgi:hypothetical protein
MHYAAIYNRPLIMTSLIMSSVDVNIKEQIGYLAVGPTPLHYAAKCGSLESACFLISNYANIQTYDDHGWVTEVLISQLKVPKFYRFHFDTF